MLQEGDIPPLNLGGNRGADAPSIASNRSDFSDISDLGLIPTELLGVLKILVTKVGIGDLRNSGDLKQLIAAVKLANARMDDQDNTEQQRQLRTSAALKAANDNFEKSVTAGLAALNIIAKYGNDNIAVLGGLIFENFFSQSFYSLNDYQQLNQNLQRILPIFNKKMAAVKTAVNSIKTSYKKLLAEVTVAERYSMNLGTPRSIAVYKQALRVLEGAVQLINDNIKINYNSGFAGAFNSVLNANINIDLELLLDKLEETVLKQNIITANKRSNSFSATAQIKLDQFHGRQIKKRFNKSLDKVKHEIAELKKAGVAAIPEKIWELERQARECDNICATVKVACDVRTPIVALYKSFAIKKQEIADNILKVVDVAVQKAEKNCAKQATDLFNCNDNDVAASKDSDTSIVVETLLKNSSEAIACLEHAVANRYKSYHEVALLLPEQNIMVKLVRKKELIKAHKKLQQQRVKVITKVQAIIAFYKAAHLAEFHLKELSEILNSGNTLKLKIALHNVANSKELLETVLDQLEEVAYDFFVDVEALKAKLDSALEKNTILSDLEAKLSVEGKVLLEKQCTAITAFNSAKITLQQARQDYRLAVTLVGKYPLGTITLRTKVALEAKKILQQEQTNLATLKTAVTNFATAVTKVQTDVVDNKVLLENANIANEQQAVAATQIKSQTLKTSIAAKIKTKQQQIASSNFNATKVSFAKQVQAVTAAITSFKNNTKFKAECATVVGQKKVKTALQALAAKVKALKPPYGACKKAWDVANGLGAKLVKVNLNTVVSKLEKEIATVEKNISTTINTISKLQSSVVASAKEINVAKQQYDVAVRNINTSKFSNVSYKTKTDLEVKVRVETAQVAFNKLGPLFSKYEASIKAAKAYITGFNVKRLAGSVPVISRGNLTAYVSSLSVIKRKLHVDINKAKGPDVRQEFLSVSKRIMTSPNDVDTPMKVRSYSLRKLVQQQYGASLVKQLIIQAKKESGLL